MKGKSWVDIAELPRQVGIAAFVKRGFLVLLH